MSSANNRPFFVNLHLMATHGPIYFSKTQKFSKNLKQTSKWQSEFYDDSIREIDASIRTIYKHLEKSGVLENTILVVTSDHGRNWNSAIRLPLMIRFPNKRNHGVITFNTSRIDVAPTLLDYMNWEQPPWLEGESLISHRENNRNERAIFSAKPANLITRGNDRWIQHQPTPPFYSLGGVGVVLCDQLFGWSLTKNTWRLSLIEGHTAP